MEEKRGDRPADEPDDEGADVEAVERGVEEDKGSLSEEIQRAPAREEESPEG